MGQLYVTLIAEGANNTWYLASCMNIADAQCEMDINKSSYKGTHYSYIVFVCYFNNQLKVTCTAFADVFDWENGPEDISQISIIAFLG